MSFGLVHDVICDACQYVFGESSPLNKMHKKDACEVYVQHLHITDLRNSYLQGCHLCALILLTISDVYRTSGSWPELCEWTLSPEDRVGKRKYDGKEDFEVWLCLEFRGKTKWGWSTSRRWDPDSPSSWAEEFCLQFFKKDPMADDFDPAGRSSSLKCWPRRGTLSNCEETPPTNLLQPVAESESDNIDFLHRRSHSWSTASEETIELIKKWLCECLESHERCTIAAREGPNELPSRLLDVGDILSKRRVKLVDSISVSGAVPYMTLSYCWGKAPCLKLTKDSMAYLRSGLHESELPLLFREVASLVCRLGYRYLWIDALCIIQDSKDDWLNESVRMRTIYAKSLLNITSTFASNSHMPLFHQRDPRTISPCLVKPSLGWFPFKEMWCSLETFPDEFLVGSRLGHFARRAWIVQEYLLAPRILEFTYDQVQWLCPSLECSEAVQTKMKSETSSDESFDWELLYPGMDSGAALRLWYKVIETYSTSKLSFESDKLPALSGIAQKFESMTGGILGNYLAGVWETDLTRQLCWHSGLGSKRADEYRAPSWSWACKDGEYYNSYMEAEGDPTILFELVKAEIVPVTSPFGPVTGGYAHVRGEMCEIFIKRHQPWNERAWDVCIEILDMQFSTFSSITDDDLTEWQRSLEAGRPFFAFLIGSRVKMRSFPNRNLSVASSSADSQGSIASEDASEPGEAEVLSTEAPLASSDRSLGDLDPSEQRPTTTETPRIVLDLLSDSSSASLSAAESDDPPLDGECADTGGKRREANWRQHMFALESDSMLDFMVLEATAKQKGQFRRVGIFSSTRLQHMEYLEEAFAASNLSSELFLEGKDEKGRYTIEIV